MENNPQIPTPGPKYQLVLPMGHQRDLNQTVNSVEAEKSMIGNNTINQEPEVEALDGLPEGFDIPQMPEAPQEYSPGLDNELKQKAESKQSDNSTFSKVQRKLKM